MYGFAGDSGRPLCVVGEGLRLFQSVDYGISGQGFSVTAVRDEADLVTLVVGRSSEYGIEEVHNHKRLYSALGYGLPDEYEEALFN